MAKRIKTEVRASGTGYRENRPARLDRPERLWYSMGNILKARRKQNWRKK